MTQCKMLTDKERAVMALARHFSFSKTGQGRRAIPQLKRSDIPKIRRMVRKGAPRAHIMAVLKIEMSAETFTRRCKELGIRFYVSRTEHI
jgi:hypothetical protein